MVGVLEVNQKQIMKIDELLKIKERFENLNIKNKKYLKEYDWFVLVPADKIYKNNDLKGQKIYMAFNELKEQLENLEDEEVKNLKMECKFVYRTNSWYKKIPESNY